jgi:hypothetical protein
MVTGTNTVVDFLMSGTPFVEKYSFANILQDTGKTTKSTPVADSSDTTRLIQ